MKIFLFYIFFAFGNMAHGATITWNGDAGDGQWTTATNWVGNVLPTSTDDVIINNGNAVTLASDSVTVNSVTLSSNSDLNIGSGASLTIVGGAPNGFDNVGCTNCDLTISGTLNVQGGNIGVNNGATVTVNTSGVLNCSNTGLWGINMTSSSGFVNNGAVSITGALSVAGIALSSATVTNTAGANMSIQLADIGSENWGVFSFSSQFTNQGNLTITGTGSSVNGFSQLQGGPNQKLENSGTVTISVPSGKKAIDASADNTVVNSGNMVGTGFWNPRSALDGTIVPGISTTGIMTYTGNQTFGAANTMQMEVNGTVPGTGHDQIVVNGTATISGTLSASINYNSPTNGERIVILQATAINGTFATVSPALPNHWSLDYSVSGEVALVYSFTPGKWDGGAGDGLWTTAANWEGDVLPNATDNVIIDNGNAVTLPSGTVTVQSITLSTGSDLITNTGTTLNVSGSTGNRIDMGSCVSCDLTIDGTLDLQGGAVGISTTSQITVGAQGIISGSVGIDLNPSSVSGIGIIINNGTISCNGINIGVITNLGSITSSITGVNAGTSSLTNSGNITLSGGPNLSTYNLQNNGTIKITGSSTFSLNDLSSTNNGTTGIFQGDGIWNLGGPYYGTIAPGDPIGTMTIGNNQTFTASSKIEIGINGATPNTQHDQLTINGTATLAGVLVPNINYTPSNGDRIVFLKATTISGTFASISPALPFDWSIDYSVPGEVALVYSYTIGKWDGAAGDGLWTTANNWEGRVLPSTTTDVVIDNGNTVTLPSGMVTVQTITLSTGSDLITNTGTTLNVSGSTGNRIDMGSCFSCDLTINGTLDLQGGALGISTTAKITVGAQGIISGSVGIDLDPPSASGTGDIINNGTISCNGINGGAITNHGSITSSITGVNPAASSSLTNNGNITLTGGSNISITNLLNNGTIKITGSSTFSMNDVSSINNSTTGIFQGDGIWNLGGPYYGTIAPGDPIGTMTIGNNQTFTASSKIEIDINGTSLGTQHDQLIVNGTATLAGTLVPNINYTPTNGDRIVFLKATTITGTFASISPALPFDWSLDYSVPGEVALVYSYTIGKWDGAAGDGLWTTANNWEGRVLPSTTTDVLIDNGNTVTLSSGTVTVKSINLRNDSKLTTNAGTTLTVSGNIYTDIICTPCELTINGSLNTQGSILTESNVTVGAQGLISASGDLNLAAFSLGESGTLTNNGTISCAGIKNAIVINNSMITATFITLNTASYSLTNNGKIIITGGSTIGLSSYNLVNNDTIKITGALFTSFEDVSGTNTSTSSVYQGDGIWKLNGPYNGTLKPGDPISTMTIGNNQTFTASSKIEIDINGTTVGSQHDQVIVNGTATLAGTLVPNINYTPSIGDRIVFLKATSISGTFATINPALPNNWSVDYSVSGEVALVYSYTPGLWDGDAGDGLWTTASNWSGDILPTGSDNVIINNGNAVTLPSGSVTVNSVSLSNNSDLSISSGASLTIAGGSPNGFDNVGCTNCDLTISGTLNVQGGNIGINNGSTITVTTSGVLNCSNTGSYGINMISSSVFVNNGTVNVTGSLSVAGIALSSATFTNATGANISIQVANVGSENWGVFSFSGQFTNQGNLSITGTGTSVNGFAQLQGGPTNKLENSGTVTISVPSGKKAIEATADNTVVNTSSGSMIGTGLWNPRSALDGTIVPGISATGIMTYTSNQTFGAANTMQMEVNGTVPGTGHDQIVVNGTATISGTLSHTLNYNTPTNGDRIVILKATTISGTFATVSPALPNHWSVDYSVPGEVALKYSFIPGKWDGGAGDGLWATPANWDGDVLPTATDNVLIDNGNTVTLSYTTAVNSVVLKNTSTLTLATGSSLTISPSSSMTAMQVGEENGDGAILNVQTGATLTINANMGSKGMEASHIVNATFVNNKGTININGGTEGLYIHRANFINDNILNISNSSTYCINAIASGGFNNTSTNNSMGVITLDGGSIASMKIAGGGTYQNSGTINITDGGTSAIEVSTNFNNTGSINITSGTGYGIYGPGSFTINNSGSITVSGTTNDAINLIPTFGTFTSTGTIQGTGTFNLGDRSLDGTVSPGIPTGIMTYSNNQVFTASNTMQMQVNGTTPGTGHDQIIVAGTATISGTLSPSINYNSPANGDRIVILKATTISGTFATVSPALPNHWSLDYSVPGEVALKYSYIPGKWDGGAGDGLWSSAANWEGDVLPTASDTVIIDNATTVTLSTGSVTVKTIQLGLLNQLNVSAGATLDVIVGSNSLKGIDRIGSIGFGNCNINNSGTINIDGGSQGIDLTEGMVLTNSPGAILTIANSSSICLFVAQGSFDNSGTINLTGGTTSLFQSGQLSNNRSTGIINIINSTGGTGFSQASDFINDGTISINKTGGTGLYAFQPRMTNNGLIVVSGTNTKAIDFDSNENGAYFTNNGTVQGIGTVEFGASFDLSGKISPGNSPGTFTFNQGQVFTPSSTMVIEVNGKTPNTEHDQIRVNGTATISGTLNASINYTPKSNDRIVIISATAVSGTFSTVSPALPTDWIIDYSVSGEVALVYSSALLPVELVFFEAKLIEDVVELTWETATEDNNEGFEIEHSTNGISWEYLGFVEGQGTAHHFNEYSFIHDSPSSGNNYYRLRQVDFDGNFEYSDIRSVSVPFDVNPIEVKLYPNPVTEVLNIKLKLAEDNFSIEIFNQAGKVVNQQSLTDTQINVADLPPGLYYLRLNILSTGKSQSHPFIVGKK